MSGGCINVNGGVFQFTKTTGTTGNIFLASNGSIYVNAVDGIEASNSNGVLNIFSASGEGVIYVEANLYEELVSTYNVDGSKVQVLADGCTAVLDEASEYYVIKAE
ncbi:MAG: hypothetical protein LUC90_12040 [Lachnospiraceae bacterium]|nr:hypothetical protein [Lachnospiraceae bacterium]